jgi:hypothetical protein
MEPVGVGGSKRKFRFTQFAAYFVIDPSTSPTTIYVRSHSRGVEKSIDGGASFQTVPGLPVLDVTALGVDPQAPANVYAGTSNGLFRTSNFQFRR